MNKTILPPIRKSSISNGSSKITALTFGVLVVCFAVGFYAVADWQPPTEAPPEGNVSAPINVGSDDQTKEGGLTINGVLTTLQDMIVNLVTIDGDGDVSTNLNADKLDDYNAADLMAGGIVGGCAGGLCSELPVGYHIDFDWDGDGYTMATGDCDETCPTCYKGSIAWTAEPDGKDQNCNGTIDETQTLTANKSCYHGNVIVSSLVNACTSWCTAQGLGYKSLTCSTYTGRVNNEDQSYNWADCNHWNPGSPSGTICQNGTDTCYCSSIGYQ